MNTVDVKGVIFNQGRPKICIPLVGNTNDEILNELAYVNTLECEVVEWRIDHYEDVLDSSKLLDLAQTIHQNLKDKVLLTTFRSFKEGGVLDIPNERYESIYISI